MQITFNRKELGDGTVRNGEGVEAWGRGLRRVKRDAPPRTFRYPTLVPSPLPPPRSALLR